MVLCVICGYYSRTLWWSQKPLEKVLYSIFPLTGLGAALQVSYAVLSILCGQLPWNDKPLPDPNVPLLHDSEDETPYPYLQRPSYERHSYDWDRADTSYEDYTIV